MSILNTEELLVAEAWDKRNTPDGAFLANAVEAAKLFNEGLSGNNPFKHAMLKEALTRSDFNLYLGKAFDIEMLAKYADYTPEWREIATPTTVKNFKPKTFRDLFGGRGALDRVAEGAEYKERNKDAAEYEISAAKYGNTFKLTFELINAVNIGNTCCYKLFEEDVGGDVTFRTRTSDWLPLVPSIGALWEF